MLGVPGIFTDEQKTGWKKVVNAVHANDSIFIMQRKISFVVKQLIIYIPPLVWHQGRNTHSRVSGTHTISSSAIPITDSKHQLPGLSAVEFETPKAMTQEDIDAVKKEYVDAAVSARQVGFDGIEVHGANG